ncbi:hypothetical protein OSB04_un001408 [Centaurea solstitialis]|uniref:MORF/ORRM1/DAG-like MORF domain-containing protein n=1 Tax=Centaurea solstitialis TaxID=347529 RepID=A0AA38VQX1_9ASTR|nr:hypothetical protein OSB04_un001408 [Centaurea solstitialis]
MAKAKAVAMGRALRSSASPFIISKRTFSSSCHIARSPPLPGSRRSAVSLSHSLQVAAVRLNPICCRVNRPGSNLSQRDIEPLFDYDRWLIVMHNPGGEGATKKQMIDCYVKTLAKVLGSEEEAKKKIYNVSCEKYFGFCCEIDEETSNKLEGFCFFFVGKFYCVFKGLIHNS